MLIIVFYQNLGTYIINEEIYFNNLIQKKGSLQNNK